MFYKEWYFIVAYSILIFSNVAESLMSVQFIEIQGSEATLLLSFFCSIQMIEMKKKVMITIVVFFFQLAIYGVIYENPQIIYFIALQCSIELIFQYVFFTGQMNTFNRTLILKKKKFQSDKLLKYLLPSHVRISLTDLADSWLVSVQFPKNGIGRRVRRGHLAVRRHSGVHGLLEPERP